METLENVIQQQITQLKLKNQQRKTAPDENNQSQGLIFIGNHHDAFPRRLLLEPYLTARDKYAWQMIRLYSQQQRGAFPSYNELQEMLAPLPGAKQQASRKVVSDTLTRLRLTRWLSLSRTVRDEVSGKFIGNIYLLHDAPLTFNDAIRLDKGYTKLLEQSLLEKNQLVQQTASFIKIEYESLPAHIRQQNHLAFFNQRLNELNRLTRLLLEPSSKSKQGEKPPSSKIEPGEKEHKKPSSKMELGRNNPSFEMEPGDKTPSSISNNTEKTTNYGKRINPSSTSTSTNSIYINTSTSNDIDPGFFKKWPIEISQLPEHDLKKINRQINKLPVSQALQVLTDIVYRYREGSINNLTAYTINTLKKAISGEYNLFYQTDNRSDKAPQHRLEHETLATIPLIQSSNSKKYLAQMRQYLNSVRQDEHHGDCVQKNAQ